MGLKLKENEKKINLLDPNEVSSFAEDTSDEGRKFLADSIYSFFSDDELSENEKQLTGKIIVNLLKQAELDLKEVLSERLSLSSRVPHDVINYLANDTISVAEHVLEKSSLLLDDDLIKVISNNGNRHWQSIAKRDDVSPVVVEALIDTSDVDTVFNLIDNERNSLKESSIRKIIKMSIVSETLQAPLLRRPEIDGQLAVDLYVCVSRQLRDVMLERFNIPQKMVESAIDSLICELSSETEDLEQVEITEEIRALAKRFNERNAITSDLMIKSLRRGQKLFFICILAEKIAFHPKSVVAMIRNNGGKGLAVSCRSIGMMKSEFASIFLLSRGVKTSDKIVDQRELAMALKYFNELNDLDIKRIMKSWAKNPDFI